VKRVLAALAAAFVLVPAAQAGSLCVSCWERVADCESSGRWWLSSGNGYHGGLQFLRSTWLAYGGGRFANYPHYASKWQQMLIAERYRRSAGMSGWPNCGGRYWG
jgi:resuscitation-promoting factor RpfA